MARAYPSYRSSGRAELGEVPSHWIVSSLGRYLFVKSGDMISAADIEEEGYPVFGGNGFRGHYHTWNTEAGTLIIGRYGALCGNVRITNQRTMATEHAFRAIAQLPFNARFFSYLIEHIDLNKFSARSAQPGLNSDLVRNNPCAVPPNQEQEAIADFLDRETARMDALIERKRRLLELLEEKRFAVITHAVTKGLDPSAPMKDSGINWLGQIPAHWEVVKGRHLGTLFGSALPSEDELIESADGDGTPFAKVDDLNSVDASLIMSSTKLRAVGYAVKPRNLILFPKRGAAIFTNKVAIIDGAWLFDSNLMGFEMESNANAKYVAYCLMARRLDDLADVSTVPQINNKHIYPAHFPRPPLSEQLQIVGHLNSFVLTTQKIAAKIEVAIRALQEYRSALITNAVTGKIKVV